MLDRIRELWCDWAHAEPMWPIHGQYECRTCGRRHDVEWARAASRQARGNRRAIDLARAAR
jgi:acetone carboxylase gamma subunit